MAWSYVDNTVAQYRFNENAGNKIVNNYGTSSTNATSTVNTNTLSGSGKIDLAFFYNASAYADAEQRFQSMLRATNSGCCWLKPSDGHPPSLQLPMGVTDLGNNSRFQFLQISDGAVQISYESDGDLAAARTDDPVFINGPSNPWTFAGWSIDETNGIILYIGNGTDPLVQVPLASSHNGSMSGVTMSNYTSNKNPYLGSWNNSGSSTLPYDGGMDDFRFLNIEMSITDFRNIYKNGIGTEAQKGGSRALFFGTDF